MVLAELEKDAASAYPGLKLFKKDGAMYAGLREFLGAWVVVSSNDCLFARPMYWLSGLSFG